MKDDVEVIANALSNKEQTVITLLTLPDLDKYHHSLREIHKILEGRTGETVNIDELEEILDKLSRNLMIHRFAGMSWNGEPIDQDPLYSSTDFSRELLQYF